MPTYVESEVIPVHAPELYRHDRLAEPVADLAAIGPAEIAQFQRDGYLAVGDAFSGAQVAAAIAGWTHLIDGGNPDFDCVCYEASAGDRVEQMSPEERRLAVRKLYNFVHHEPRLQAIAADPRLLEVVSRMVGAEPRMFQDMALSKPPRLGREKPWHQDCSYFNMPLGTPVVGVWIALDQTTLANGCMHVMHQGHQLGPVIHFQRRDWQICDRDAQALHDPAHPIVAVPLPPGGCLFFSGMLPHGTPHNHSGSHRRALQYHYCPVDSGTITTDERLALFGSEGKDVTC